MKTVKITESLKSLEITKSPEKILEQKQLIYLERERLFNEKVENVNYISIFEKLPESIKKIPV